jgi:hypothetical protein
MKKFLIIDKVVMPNMGRKVSRDMQNSVTQDEVLFDEAVTFGTFPRDIPFMKSKDKKNAGVPSNFVFDEIGIFPFNSIPGTKVNLD